MALQPVDLAKYEDLLPQFEGVLAEVYKKLSVLVGKKISTKSLELYLGDYADFFKKYKKRYLLTKVGYDGEKGAIFFLVPMELAIALSAMLMGKPEKTILDKIEAMDFDDELSEVYQEISNQLCGILNQVLAAQVDADIHLTLVRTEDMPANGSKNTKIIDPFLYLCGVSVLNLDQIGEQSMYCLISRDFTRKFFDADMGSDVAASSSIGSIADAVVVDSLAAKSQQEPKTAADVMTAEYPTIDLYKTVGDAYEVMNAHDVDTLPITDDGTVVRMISKNNIEIIRSIFFDAPGQEVRIARLMGLSLSEINPDQNLIFVKPKDSVSSLCEKLIENKISSLPVLDEEKNLLGVVTSLNLLKLLM